MQWSAPAKLKGSVRRRFGEKSNRFFSGFFPWQVREWYVPGPSRHHQIPNILRTLHIFQTGFFRVLTGFFWKKKPGRNLVHFSPTPSMADLFQIGGPRNGWTKMASTDESAFFSLQKHTYPGGGSRIRLKKHSKHAFRLVPVRTSIYPEEGFHALVLQIADRRALHLQLAGRL